MFKLLSLAVVALLSTGADATYLRQRQSPQPQELSGRQFLAQLMHPVVDDIMEQFDLDKSGKISKEEFKKTLIKLAKDQKFEVSANDLKRAEAEFDKTDTSGDGEVSVEELKAVIEHM